MIVKNNYFALDTSAISGAVGFYSGVVGFYNPTLNYDQ